jgi:ABC-type transport system involved in multi-copper enzyme maturation permease subunit
MKTFLAVARREVIEKKFILWVALVAATQPFMVPIVRGLAGDRARDVRESTALILGLGMATAVAAGLGSSLFAGELAARRMGFYFSRPISSFTLWAGKLAAAGALMAFVLAVFLGPVALLEGNRSLAAEFGVSPTAAVALLAWLFLVVHTVSLIAR